MDFLDTNILLYSISSAPDEARKRSRAIELLDRDDVALSVQVLQEFYVQATRASRSDPLPHDIACGLIQTWLRFTVQETTLDLLSLALSIHQQHDLSYWDAAIVAAAKLLGCRRLYTEDLTHGQRVEGVVVHNPFR